MATVIDELIVKLSLDPSEFDAGERRMITSLRRMEASAQRGERQVTEAAGISAASFFRSIENPIAGLRRAFEGMAVGTVVMRTGMRGLREETRDLGRETQTWSERFDRIFLGPNAPRAQFQRIGEQGKRTGEDIAQGMGIAATGVRALGVAGLAAFASYELFTKTLGAAGNVAQRVFQTGIGAGGAGMGLTEFHAVGLAAEKYGNVPPENIEAWLANFRAMQLQVPMGQLGEGNQFMIRLQQVLSALEGTTGIRSGLTQEDFYQGSPETMLTKLAPWFARMTQAQAFSAGRQIFGAGGENIGEWLRRAGPGIAGQIAERRRDAMTPGEEAAARELIQAQKNLTQAWNGVYNAIMTGGLASALTKFANWLADLVRSREEGGGGFFQVPPKPGEPGYWLDPHGNVAPASAGRQGTAPGSTRTGMMAPLASGNQYAGDINAAARQWGVPPQLLYNLAGAESGFAPDVVSGQRLSSAGATGLMQFMPGTAARYQVDPTNSTSSIFGAAHYLSDLYNKHGSWTGALGEYSNQGPQLHLYAAEKGTYGKELVRMAQEFDAEKRSVAVGAGGDLSWGMNLGTSAGQQPGALGAEFKPNWVSEPQPVRNLAADLWDWMKREPISQLLTTPADELVKGAGTLPDYGIIQRSNATSTTVVHNHDYGDVNMNGDIVVNAPSREGGAIAGTVRDQIQKLTPLANPANAGLQ